MAAEVIRQVTVRLSQWSGLELTALHTPDGVFFPVKYLCAVLLDGVNDYAQRQRIKRDPILSDPSIYREYPVQTPGGAQTMYCLERLGIARFLDGISQHQLRPQLRERILQLQWDITFSAHRLFWGEVDAESPAPTMLVPATRNTPRALQLRHDAARLREDDVKRFLLGMADRIGPIEIASRELQTILHAMADTTRHWFTRRCPKCGYALYEESDDGNTDGDGGA